MKRLFVAIKIIPDAAFLSIYQKLRLQLSLDKIKWVEPKNFHLTLKFIGKTPEDRLNVLHTALQKVAICHAGFDLCLQKTGIFGSSYQPRVIWLGSDEPAGLRILGDDVLNSLNTVGFLRDKQNFVPHLTIGRIKQLNNKKYFQDIIAQFRKAFSLGIKVDKFFLYESILMPKGPVYRVLQSYDLSMRKTSFIS